MRNRSPVRSWRRRAHRAKTSVATSPNRQRDQHVAEVFGELRPRQEQPAIVEEPAAGKRHAAAQFGQRFEHGVVPEQKLQQERHVADQFDIAAGQMRHQPIARQPRDADGEAEHGREHDADAGNQKRVEKPDPERAAERRRARRIGDQRLADIEARGIVPEAEARGDMRCARDCARH